MYNVLGSTGIAGGLLFRSLRSLNHLKALNSKRHTRTCGYAFSYLQVYLEICVAECGAGMLHIRKKDLRFLVSP